MASVRLSGASPSDLLRSSSNGANGVPLKLLGRSRMGMRSRRVPSGTVLAKIKKVKKHEYPWPDDIDPNVKGGPLSYLSHFKPLKEKPKPVTLSFEKPLMDLEKKIINVRKMADETGLDFSDQIISLESKYQQALKDLYTHLTPIQRMSIARHPNRPTFLDHVLNITDKWVELHGDRAGYDDPAIVTGIGSIEGRSFLFIGHQKGRSTKEHIHRNFGMPTPHGYRKALRMMRYADHHGFPIITFIDTPGAYADLKSEELGQGEAIAYNLRTMFGLKVPIVAVVIGEGGSGGALAIGCANKLLMLENAVFYVASPEACAAILWKSSKAAPKAAEKLKITATELCKLKIADGIIPEPLGGAHTDPSWTSQQIKIAVMEAMNELLDMGTPELLSHRMLKFRQLGGFIEGEAINPSKKANMKKKEEPIVAASGIDLEMEIEKLKQQKSGEDSTPLPSAMILKEAIEKLKKEVDQEYFEAVSFMGLQDRFEMLRKEVTGAKTSSDQRLDPTLAEKIEKLKQDFNQGLLQCPNYASLSHKLDMLREISEAHIMSLKQEISQSFKEVMDRPDIKGKMDVLKADIDNAGVSEASDLNDDLKKRILRLKREIESEASKELHSNGMDVEFLSPKEEYGIPSSLLEQTTYANLKGEIEELNNEIKERIEDATNSSDLKNKMETLKLEVAKAGNSPDPVTTERIEEMKLQIKHSLAAAVDSRPLAEKYEKLKQKIARAYLSLQEELEEGSSVDEDLSQDALREEEKDFEQIKSY